jgi:hypothetical protein
MIRFIRAAVVGMLGSILGLGMGVAATPACVRHWPEVRYGNLGYDHIVHLRNDCRAQASCAVSTNVNPKPVTAEVPVAAEVDVLTMRGSPAREFIPHVECAVVR